MANLKLKKSFIQKDQKDQEDQEDQEDLKKENKSNVSLVPSDIIDAEQEIELKDKKKKFSKYFYKVSNHSELNKIGGSYYEEFKSGIRSFAIASTGYTSSQQRTILGLASYFDHKDDLSILIVSNNLKEGCFTDIINASKVIERSLATDQNQKYSFHRFHHHFDFISFDEIIKFSDDDNPSSDYEESIDSIIGNYDLIFWDVPPLETIQKNSGHYFPVTMKFERLTIVVSQSVSNVNDVEEVKSFFLNYGVSLKGLLMDTSEINKKKPKKKGFGGFFR